MAAVQFLGELVRKTGDAGALALEAEKARRAREIGLRTGLFYVPEVVDLDTQNGVLDTERVYPTTRLLDLALARDPLLTELCFRAGKALAAIQADLNLPAEMQHAFSFGPASQEQTRGDRAGALVTEQEPVVLHGDFNGDNVMYDAANDRLIIIDWSSAPGFDGPFTTGSRYFDIVWFGIFFYRFQPMTALGWQPKRWLRRLIEGYRTEGGLFDPLEYESFKRQIDPLLRHDYNLQCVRKGRGIRRVPYLLRRSITWRMWQECNPAKEDFWLR